MTLSRLVWLSLMLTIAGPLSAMEAMSQHEMSSVTGQDGIAFEWDLRINANADGTPDTSLSKVERRLAISLAARDGEWLVMKGLSGRINFPTFNLNAVRSPLSPSKYGDTTRFVDGGGTLVSPYDRPNLLLTFPEAIEFYNVQVGGMAIEYGSTGYLADPTDADSFLSLGLNNSIPGQPGTLDAQGRATIFGF